MDLIDGHKDFGKAKSAFLSGRGKATTEVVVKWHCIEEHIERKFTIAEINRLIRRVEGTVEKNTMPKATPGSIMFICKDRDNDDCEFAVLVHYDRNTGNRLIVVHAFRKDKP